MANIYKRFGEQVTALRSDLFAWARIKLTALYLLIITIILMLFSVTLYANLGENLHRDFDRHELFTVNGSEENAVEDALEKLEASILTADVVVLIIAGVFSYGLAGYTLRPIKKALDAQTQFSAEASHELRTPLAVMRTDIEVLLKGNHNLPTEAKEVLKSNLEEIEAISGMSEQLLELSRGKKFLVENRQRLNLTELAKNVSVKLAGIASNKQIALAILPSPEVFVFGSKHDLERVLNNLIINAITYTPEQGSIKLTIEEHQNLVELSITDTGIGIPARDLSHVFEAFYKVDRSRTVVENHKGAGLGLAIVKQIVEQHHGAVEIKSLENKGTTFIIRLPAAKL